MNILVFAGTTEGRELTELLAAMGASPTVSVATDYGKEVLRALPKSVRILAGRQSAGDIAILLKNGAFHLVVDATHPYAVLASANIRQASRAAGVQYLRLARQASHWERCVAVASTLEAVEWLAQTGGTILLTTGSKELAAYATLPDFASRVYARVLPVAESLAECARHQLPPSHIIAMQGPFSREMNKALIHQYNIDILVTKDGGQAGGFAEKAAAADETGIRLLVIGRPADEGGMEMEDVVDRVRELLEAGA